MPGLEIVTPRLILRPANLADAPAVQRAKEDMWDDLQLWMSWSYDDQKPYDALLAYIDAATAISPYESLWAFRRDTAEFVVATGLMNEGDGVFVTGYWTPRRQQGHGFATEATNAVIRHAFGALEARACTINFYEDNRKSAAVIGRLGFTPTRIDAKSRARCKDGTLLDVHHFNMTDPAVLPPLEVSWGNEKHK